MLRADAFPPDVWAALCTPMHEILPAGGGGGALFLGSWTAAVDPELLARHAVRAIVECHDSPWGTCESALVGSSSSSSAPAPAPALSPTQQPGLARSPTSSALVGGAERRPPLPRTMSAADAGAQGAHGYGGGGEAPIGRFKVALADSAAPDALRPHLDGAVRFIRERLARGENVLVHCQQGISRSPAIVLAYLMRERALSYDAALQLVLARRRCVKPNAGFERTLRGWK